MSFTVVGPAIAQQQPTLPPPTTVNPSRGANVLEFFSGRTPYEFWLTCIIGLIGLIIIAVLTWSISRMDRPRPEDITRPIIVVTVIIGTLILVTAGYSNEQIAPAFGLFGTIVGYILGRLSQSQLASVVQGTQVETRTETSGTNTLDPGGKRES
jgi:hypothetical protein